MIRKYKADETQNCMQCCLAAIFDKFMHEIPTVHEWSKQHSYWFKGFYNWSVLHMGHVPVAIVDDTLDDIFHIAIIRQEGTPSHAVVAKGTEVVWDPGAGEKVTDLLDVSEWEYSIVFLSVADDSMQSRLLKDYRDEQR
jgi:hypothetical protein